MIIAVLEMRMVSGLPLGQQNVIVIAVEESTFQNALKVEECCGLVRRDSE